MEQQHTTSEFVIVLDGKILPPSYSKTDPVQWKKTLSTFQKIGKKHGVKFKLTGSNSFNPNYKTTPTFKTESEAKNLESELKSVGLVCYTMDVQPNFWG